MASESTDSLSPGHDKQWARKYLLDPLTAPEPNQETGPGSSFLKPSNRLALQPRTTQTKRPSPPSSNNNSYQTPRSSASPKPRSFSFSNLFRRRSLRQKQEGASTEQSQQQGQPRRPAIEHRRTRSAESNRNGSFGVAAGLSTPVTSLTRKYPPSASQNRGQAIYTPNSGRNSRKEDKFVEAAKTSPPNRSPSSNTSNNPFFDHRHTISGSGPSRPLEPRPVVKSALRKSNSTNTRPSQSRALQNSSRPGASNNPFLNGTYENLVNSNASGSSSSALGIRRNRSVNERPLHRQYLHHDSTMATQHQPRPLELIKRDVRAADKGTAHRRRGLPETDQIDVLDKATVGGPYHHGGPYDATLASRNINPIYSPVAAVHDSNMEALKATPREYVQDSLRKHMPLQGTATVPPGERDLAGRVMAYEEGADLMREADAPGGAYKRWEGLNYHPDDLKGKSEPSYSIEKAEKERRRLRKNSVSAGSGPSSPEGGSYEMSSRTSRKDGGVMARQRSMSSAAAEPRTSYLAMNGGEGPSMSTSRGGDGGDDEDGLRRRNTTGKRLKRHLGSIRRRRRVEDDADDY